MLCVMQTIIYCLVSHDNPTMVYFMYIMATYETKEEGILFMMILIGYIGIKSYFFLVYLFN